MTEETVEDIPKILILDGGFSTQLTSHVGAIVEGDPLWSARYLQTNPKEVINTHLDFLRGGSDAIMTNTYQASVEGFVKYLNVTPDEGLALIHRAVDLAKTARNIYLEECQRNSVFVSTPLIIGSIGPYGACLHDGSEYSGNYADTTSVETLREWHAIRLKALVSSGVDLIAFETVPCRKEAEVLVDMLKEYPTVKAWVSFSCKNGISLVNGENFQETAKKCWDMNPDQLVAVGVNCCSPTNIAQLFKNFNQDRSTPIPLITYPNSGEKYISQIGWIEEHSCDGIDTFVQEWLDLGVRYIGGCCRTYATDIMRIKTQVSNWLDKKKFKIEQ
jgi:homocysteine S-methyltransferase